MGKRELKNEILTIEDVFKVIEFIAFGISNNFISHRTPLYWGKAVDEFHRCKSCGITYFKRTKDSFPILILWAGFYLKMQTMFFGKAFLLMNLCLLLVDEMFAGLLTAILPIFLKLSMSSKLITFNHF